jgi:hypothetical protein
MTLVNVALRLRVAFMTPTSLASFPPPRFGPWLEEVGGARYCGIVRVSVRAFHGAFGRGHRARPAWLLSRPPCGPRSWLGRARAYKGSVILEIPPALGLV